MPVEYSPSITSARIIPSLLRCPLYRVKIRTIGPGCCLHSAFAGRCLESLTQHRPYGQPSEAGKRWGIVDGWERREVEGCQPSELLRGKAGLELQRTHGSQH